MKSACKDFAALVNRRAVIAVCTILDKKVDTDAETKQNI